ncbi:phosphoadenosine phosphosulfate reductase family protein (plasmid) [Paenibacillus sp. S-38]|uniref:phosphoadenosine phosphosulfate reductase domain-containing protein n=1 Tax=Paenibacillus sp. S-38 TaxID=3416710 RepID=UPI003CF03FAF
MSEVMLQDKHEDALFVRLLNNLNDYDVIIVALSGGKDSVACILDLIDQGVDRRKIEIWHQSIDDGEEFMDWACTESYVQAFGDLMGVEVYFQWREGGFKGELYRKDSIKGGVYYYAPGGGIEYLPSREQPPTTRMKFPQLGFDLAKRWCSGELKMDVAKRVIANDERYQGTLADPKKILYISGERREESEFRSKYNAVQLHTTHCKSRTVHHWRPVLDYKERDVWDLYEKYRLRPHPAYQLGWSRTSCFGCIFSTPDLWAMMREIAPERFQKLLDAEREIDHTIQSKRVKGKTVRISIEDLANKGSLHRLPAGERLSRLVYEALNPGFRFTPESLILDKWELPAGAFKGNEGGSL